MREILFRGKRTDNGKWVEGEMLHDMQDRPHLYWKTPKELPIVFSNHAIVDPATLGQFTGLTDRNGVKIFEGDILKCSDGTTCIVEWDNENARFLGFTIGKCRSIAYVGREPKSEVIGNIHDNPELLEVTADA